MNEQKIYEEEIDTAEMLYWIEFGAWSSLVMAPIIWWLQGPSVSTDQFVMRTGLVVLSSVTAVGLRIWKLIGRPARNLQTPASEARSEPEPRSVSPGI